LAWHVLGKLPARKTMQERISMTPSSNTPTVYLAATESTQTAALAEMLSSIRPGIRTLRMDEEGSEESEAPWVAMVVEPTGPEMGELSRRVRSRFPSAGLVIIAPRFDDRAIEVAAEVEASSIVPSPCEPNALLRVLKAHEQRVRFVGRAGGVETAELLRLHGIARSEGVLHLRSAQGSGAIHLDGGQPIHAHIGELRGAEAVRELLGWRDARATWIAGRSASARTIVGRLEGLLQREAPTLESEEDIGVASRDVIEKLERLAQTQDILAAYLLRNGEVIMGRATAGLDEALIGRALSRLTQVFHDMEEQQGDEAGTEIQATVGEHRLVVDRLGPTRLGFQIGVVVRQATPVCKSLRRLLRQIDRSFRKSLNQLGRASKGEAGPGVEAAGLHRVA
jgi:hypothetical protein